MKKLMRNPIILLTVVLIVLIFAYVGLSRYNAAVEESEQQAEEESMLYVSNYDSLDSFSFSDDSNSLSFEKNEESDWTIVEAPDVPVDQTTLSSLETSLAQISASRELTEDIEELSNYGLDDSTYEINLIGDDGSSMNLEIGNALSDGTSYYAKMDTNDTVYVIDGNFVYNLSFDINGFVTDPEVPNLNSETIISIERITNNQSQTLTADDENDNEEEENDSEEESEDSESSEESTPFDDAASTLASLIMGSSVDYSPSDEDLSVYGLDESNRITYTVTYTEDEDTTEKEFTFYAGLQNTEDPSNYYYYGQVQGNSVIYQIYQANIESLETAFAQQDS